MLRNMYSKGIFEGATPIARETKWKIKQEDHIKVQRKSQKRNTSKITNLRLEGDICTSHISYGANF